MSKTITTINLDKKVNTAVVEFLVNLSAETTDQQLKAIASREIQK